MNAHTPTPWKFSPNSFGTQFIYGGLETPKQNPMGVTYFHLVAGGDHPATLTEANAALIVEAVNSHAAFKSRIEKLEAALRETRRFVEEDPTALSARALHLRIISALTPPGAA